MGTSAANKQTNRANLSTWLLNPFHFVAGGQALALGLLAIITTGLLASIAHIRFDSILFFSQLGYRKYPIWLYLTEHLMPWIILSAILCAIGKIISNSKIRVIDVFGTQALARWPVLIFALLVQSQTVRRSLTKIMAKIYGGAVPFLEVAVSLALSIVLIMLGIWVVLLMYHSFSISCNVKSTKAVVAFIGSFLAAEFIWKIALLYLVV